MINLPLSSNSIYSQIFFMVPPATLRKLPVNLTTIEPRADYFDDVDALFGIPKLEIADGVAVIPVRGVLAQNVSRMDRWYGFWGYEQILADLAAAEADPKCRAILLNIDSPGGQACGALETATRLAESTKPLVAFTPGLMASAAYYIARGTAAVLCAPSAIVGSIGTYMTIYDFSAYCEELGIEVTVLRSGKHKGAGEMGTSLTEEQTKALQDIVDTLGAQFRSFVSEHAPDIAPEALEGQAFVGTEAEAMGLVDDLATLEQAKTFALDLAE